MSNYEGKIIIGITGVAQAGKDTAAKRLIEGYGFKRIAFADKLREVLLALDPIVTIPTPLYREWRLKLGEPAVNLYRSRLAQNSTEIFFRLSSVVESVGWDEAKRAPEVRALLQRQGDEAGRVPYGEQFWVEQAFNKILPEDGRVVFTDVRYDNEAAAIREAGGTIFKIERRGVEAVNGHRSDAGIDPKYINITIANNYDIKSLHHLMDSAHDYYVMRRIMDGVFLPGAYTKA
jgi:hypothetical protein